MSQDTTVPGSPQSWTTTIPMSQQSLKTEKEVEAISSDSEVEIVAVKLPPKVLTPEQELAKMKEHERFGHYWRVLEKQEAVDRRVRAVSEAVAQESPADRRVRRKTFHKVVLNHEA